MRDKETSIKSLLEFLKINFRETETGQLQLNCWECGKAGHLYVDEADGTWYCHKCQAAGNRRMAEAAILHYVVSASEMDPRGREYFEARHLKRGVIEEAQLGYYMSLKRYVIPHINEAGVITNITFRSADGSEPKYIRLPGYHSLPYVIGNPNAKLVIITEGEIDALSARQALGEEALVIGLPGASIINDALVAAIPQGAVVVGVMDNDQAGKIARKKLKLRIPSIKFVGLPDDINDLNDLLRRDGEKAVKDLLASTEIPEPEKEEVPLGLMGVPSTLYVSMPDTQGDWLVEDLWMDGALGFVAGVPKAGKSLLALHMAYHVAEGIPFLGKKIHRPGPVLLVQEEDSDHLIRKRLRAIKDGRGSSGLIIMTPGVTGTHIRLDSEDSIELLDKTIAAVKPVLVILDPLANMHSLEDENNAGAMNRILERIRWLRDLRKCSFMIIHHLRKNAGEVKTSGRSMRGSSVFHAKAECAIYAEQIAKDLLLLSLENKMGARAQLEARFSNTGFEVLNEQTFEQKEL